MAAMYTQNAASVSIRLNNGTQSGVVKTVGVSLGKLSSRTDLRDTSANGPAQKVLNIVSLAGNVFSKEIYAVEATMKGRLSIE